MTSKLATEQKTIRVALYCRVSTDEQNTSLQAQQNTLKQYAKLHSWDVAGVYIDEGISGGTDQRPQLQNMLLDARNGNFDIVVATKVDRFSRNVRHLQNFIYELEKMNVAFVSLDGTDTRQPGQGKIFLNFLGSMAEFERERIGERIKDARKHLRSKRQWNVGKPPYGYRYDKQTKQIKVYEQEAAAVRFIFDQYTTKNTGAFLIAQKLNDGVYLPPVGRFWNTTAIYRILHHPAYYGGEHQDWIYKSPAIVDKAVWELAQALLKRHTNFKPTRTDSGLVYHSKLVCGVCGQRLHIGYNRGRAPVYECHGRRKARHLDGSARCTLPRMKAPALKGITFTCRFQFPS